MCIHTYIYIYIYVYVYTHRCSMHMLYSTQAPRGQLQPPQPEPRAGD